jgi:hypothetical protein
MNATPNPAAINRTLLIVRWIARTLSVLILLFWGYFIVAHIFGTAAQSSRPLTANDSVQFAMVVFWLVGLALAWRWELAGAVMALAAAIIGGLINPLAVTLGLVPSIPAVLFLVCWWRSRASRRENHAA